LMEGLSRQVSLTLIRFIWTLNKVCLVIIKMGSRMQAGKMIKLASFNCPTNLKRLDRVPQFLGMLESLESVPVDISQARSVIIMEKVLVVLEIEDVRILV
jgi:hypothetical protein